MSIICAGIAQPSSKSSPLDIFLRDSRGINIMIYLDLFLYNKVNYIMNVSTYASSLSSTLLFAPKTSQESFLHGTSTVNIQWKPKSSINLKLHNHHKY